MAANGALPVTRKEKTERAKNLAIEKILTLSLEQRTGSSTESDRQRRPQAGQTKEEDLVEAPGYRATLSDEIRKSVDKAKCLERRSAPY